MASKPVTESESSRIENRLGGIRGQLEEISISVRQIKIAVFGDSPEKEPSPSVKGNENGFLARAHTQMNLCDESINKIVGDLQTLRKLLQ